MVFQILIYTSTIIFLFLFSSLKCANKLSGKLTVANLGGSIEAETGFQLFLTERIASGASSNPVFSDIAKISKVRSY